MTAAPPRVLGPRRPGSLRPRLAGGLRLAVERRGAGAPLLWLHGFTGRGAGLRESARLLGPRGHLLVDLPGHGGADAPPDARAYAFPHVVDRLARLLDALRVPATDVVGYSLGARLALGLAVRHPARVRRLVLVGARAGLADPAARRARAAADEALAARIEARGLAWFVAHWESLPLFASQVRLAPAERARIRAERLASRPEGLAGALRGLGPGAQPPLFAALPRVAAPALLVAGAEDPRFVAAARDLRARLPRARLAVIPEAGHAAHLEQPEAFARAARAFLAGPQPACGARRTGRRPPIPRLRATRSPQLPEERRTHR